MNRTALLALVFACCTHTPTMGRCIGHTHFPAYTTVSFVYAGKTLVPITTVHPDRWVIEVDADGEAHSIDVSTTQYASIHDGDTLTLDHESVRGCSCGYYVTGVRRSR